MKKYEFSKDQRIVIEKMRQPFAICQLLDQNIEALAISDGFCELFGYDDREQVCYDMKKNMFKDTHPDDTAKFMNAILRFGAEDEKLDLVYRTKKADGSGYMIVHLYGEHVDTEEGQSLAHLWFIHESDYDETADADQDLGNSGKTSESDIEKAMQYDYLTGLQNMSRFFVNAEIGRKNIFDQGGSAVMLYINLSGMKHFNHKYGFAEGDILLKYFARLLSRIFNTENCCHIGADRFAVFTEESGLEDKLNELFEEWRRMYEERHLPVCVGIYPDSIEQVTGSMAYDRAKIACDVIKDTYVSSFNYFSKELNEIIEKKQYILDTFDTALQENWIQVYYQSIKRAVNGKVCNEEALARWIDPEKGFLSPADFIPYLEDAGLIYKLDLYVLEKILEHIKLKEEKGLYVVPHSVNLSRSDFDACDMVEEIRKRVDSAGVSRDRISIEITESVIGKDFDFMKKQVERFQELGFPVWMDDFGSGYSSLDVLQSIKFDLLKFDMEFMRKLDESDDGRIILTELMKMAMALGIDTICEGVETEEQVHFLQEIGCSKLQGFYFSKPQPVDAVLEFHNGQELCGYENPNESDYYELVCGINLYDVSVIAREETSSLQNAYSTLPMCIIEVKDNKTRFVRTNQSYRDFFKRFFDLELSNLGSEFVDFDAAFMQNVVKTCCEKGVRTFYNEKMSDGSIIHSFARKIGHNPITGSIAIAIAVLSIREPNEKLMIEQILSVLEEFGESMPGGFFVYRADEKEELLYANRAVCDIFGCRDLDEFKKLTGFTFKGMVHPDDYEKIESSIENQVKTSQTDLDFVEYRIIRKDGAIRWIDDYGHYIEYDDENSLYYVFISDITDKYEKAESDKALRAAVIEALTKAYDSVWLINDLEKQQFELFRIDKEMEHLMPANIAVKIQKFSQALEFYSQLVLEEDRQDFLAAVTPKSIEENTEDRLLYSVPFRRVFDNDIRHYRLEFTKLELPDGKKGIVAGFKNADEEVRKDQQIQYSLDHRAAVIEALSRSYDSVWIISDMETEQFELCSIEDSSVNFMPALQEKKITRFSDALAFYSNYVHEEDRQHFLDAVAQECIMKNTENKKTYVVPFRRVFKDEIRNYRVEFLKLDLGSGKVNIVAGFKDLDSE